MTREEAINKLEYLINSPVGREEIDETCYEVMDYLSAQEPRVMTWQEVIGAAIECKPLYIEVKDSEEKEPGDDRWAMVTQYKDSITNGMIRAMSSYVTSEVLFAEDYGKRWRCWTARPTDAQKLGIEPKEG